MTSPFEQLHQRGMMTACLTEIVRQRHPQLRQVVARFAEQDAQTAVAQLAAQGRVIEIRDDHARLCAIAADYAREPEGTLVISPANQECVALNNLIHHALQQKGLVSRTDHPTRVYAQRAEMTGAERTFAQAYQPGEDILRYSHTSRVYGVEAGDYGRVIAKDYERNTITVMLLGDEREITYDPRRLSGVNVYCEAERSFAEGDRIQFRAPLSTARVANGELGQIERISGEELSVRLESGRSVSVDTTSFRHLDHGYAVTSHSSQGQTVERVLINADTREDRTLLNARMGYVALSRAREEAVIYTSSAAELGAALSRRTDKELALDALKESCRQTETDHQVSRTDSGRQRSSPEVELRLA